MEAWKRREQDAAALFGARRNVLSGSSGRDDRDSSDSTHENLYIETKKLAKTAVRTLWARTKAFARKCGRAPVLVIFDAGKPGGLIVVHEDDFAVVVVEWMAARDRDSLLEIADAIRRRREGEGEEA